MATKNIKREIGFKDIEKRLHFQNENNLKRPKIFQRDLEFQPDR